MHIRDKELAQLKKYAQGLGITVTIKPGVAHSNIDAEWALDGSDITLYTYSKDNKTDMILKLLHELGHHLEFIYRGRKHPEVLDKALGMTPPLPKKYRKAIYDNEVSSATYHTVIANEVGLRIPLWKILVERDHQLEIYKYYYLNGKDCSKKEKDQMRKDLIAKYKK